MGSDSSDLFCISIDDLNEVTDENGVVLTCGVTDSMCNAGPCVRATDCNLCSN
jgi:hypothetical protein